MSENYDRSTPTPGDQEWVLKYYPPPEGADQYASRALPLLPMLAGSGPRPLSAASSLFNLEEDHTPRHLFTIDDDRETGHRNTTTSFAGAINEHALDMVRPSHISIPAYNPHADEHPEVVSPQPQRPDSKLIAIWANGDDLVSPIDTPGTSSWRHHVVSPMSDDFGMGGEIGGPAAPTDYESWFDDTSSDEEEQQQQQEHPESSNLNLTGGEESPLARYEDAFPEALSSSNRQLPKNNFRYSDPGSPLSPGFDMDGFGEPGPDVGGSYFEGRRTVQPQMHYRGGGRGDHGRDDHLLERNLHAGEPRITFAVPNISSFSSRTGGQRPVPPPLNLGNHHAVAQEEFVKTPFPPRPETALSVSENAAPSSTEETSPGRQKRRSGLSRFGSLRRRPSRQNSPRPPPGFTEILSQLDKHGVVSPTPRAKGILSKAKQGLGIGSDESKRDRRRDEHTRQVRQ
ncbi:hypothetical protein F5Y03DRAFT_410572 [Xylaria venustula]|nr:hypothetical protein F5Y03DRAFT_410572 [Xylaria venustula]